MGALPATDKIEPSILSIFSHPFVGFLGLTIANSQSSPQEQNAIVLNHTFHLGFSFGKGSHISYYVLSLWTYSIPSINPAIGLMPRTWLPLSSPAHPKGKLQDWRYHIAILSPHFHGISSLPSYSRSAF